jgi:hypothetical protein
VRFIEKGAFELTGAVTQAARMHFPEAEIAPCFPYWGNPNDLPTPLPAVEGTHLCWQSMVFALKGLTTARR